MQSVIITGASSGIGAATAKLFSQKGYFVYLLGRNEQKLSEIKKQCGLNSKYFAFDLNNPNRLSEVISEIINESKNNHPLEILINNAGIFERAKFENNFKVWQEMFQTNLFSAIELTQIVYKHFQQKKSGSIVNVSSTLGIKPSPETLAYSASKAAMNNWTQGLALEAAPFNIRVNAVCPGIVDTPIHSFHNLDNENKKKALEKLNPLQPLQRIGVPEEVAEAIYFLASSSSSWTTGSLLNVDGGINLL